MVEAFMLRALELAKKGEGSTSPNPCVGAVIVKGGVIVGEGWHKAAGEEHAEIMAIDTVMAKSGIKTVDLDPNLFHNAVLYITLEPCCHYGKTPPCTERIVAAGFKKVCIGMKDPFKKVNGKGVKYLKNHAVDVQVCKVNSKLVEEIRKVNQPFIKHSLTGLPYVLLKAGISLDGKIATKLRDSKWITSEISRKDARLLRSSFDAVLVGVSTVVDDNPELSTSPKFAKKKLLRVILDRRLRAPISSKVFRDENVFVACSDLATKSSREKFKRAGIDFKSFGKKDINIKKLLEFLAKRSVQSIFVEGGSTVNGYFFDSAMSNEELLDKVVFYVAPRLIGGKDALSVIGGEGSKKVSASKKLLNLEVSYVGDDLKISGLLNFY